MDVKIFIVVALVMFGVYGYVRCGFKGLVEAIGLFFAGIIFIAVGICLLCYLSE